MSHLGLTRDVSDLLPHELEIDEKVTLTESGGGFLDTLDEGEDPEGRGIARNTVLLFQPYSQRASVQCLMSVDKSISESFGFLDKI